jgi:prepilin-type N-terminal cleavage/methylation domain-containing protein
MIMMPTRKIRNKRGFTIVEIVVVLVLISIIAAAVFQRSITTDQMNFVSQYDKIQNQIRYPQSMAMKRSQWWGFSCDTNHYWIFSGTNKSTVANHRNLPGQQNTLIFLNDLGINMTGFTVFFDEYGRPYDSVWTTPLVSPGLTVNLDDGGTESRSFTIEPETGLVK